jgi:membrane associated rhomboid family serine protease
MSEPFPASRPRQPILNVPPVVTAVLALLALVHAVRALLSRTADLEVLLLFAFIPARYEGAFVPLPGGWAADIWTFFTYALIHADLTHLGFNAIWLLAFGTPLARRFGAFRFLLFCAVTAAAGALAHLLTHSAQVQPMVGASAIISGAMAAAMRFAFQPGGGMQWRGNMHLPAVPLFTALRDPRVLVFLVVWFGLNLLFGLGSVPLLGNDQPVAWQAHVGGFLAGLLLFSFFDPADRAIAVQNDSVRPL